MKHRIGQSHNSSGFNLVTDVKLVKEESFYQQLTEAITGLGAKNSKEALSKAKEILLTGKAVTIVTKYFIITKR